MFSRKLLGQIPRKYASSFTKLHLCNPKRSYIKMIDHLKSFSTRSITKTALITSSCFTAANILPNSLEIKKAFATIAKEDISNELNKDNKSVVDSITNVVKNEDIIKRANDKKKYEAFTLPNGIRVLLVSDSSSISAAAAIDVHVGSFNDPEDIPGLAHFCEHMSFLGNKKYPKENEYSSFLASHGGEYVRGVRGCTTQSPSRVSNWSV
jgi:hypothetical protein